MPRPAFCCAIATETPPATATATAATATAATVTAATTVTA